MENTNIMVLDNSTEVMTQEFKGLLENTLNEVFNTTKPEELMTVIIADNQVKEYKSSLAKARKLFKEQDELRKAIHNEVDKKYKAYEDIFKKEFKAPLEEVLSYYDNQLKEIEQQALNTKISGLLTYLEIKTKDTELDGIVTLLNCGIDKVINSKSDKDYHLMIDKFVDKAFNDLVSIDNLPDAKYVKYEYLKHFDLAKALADGTAAAQALEEKQVEVHEEHLEEPVEVIEEPLMEFTLSIKATATQIRALKKTLADLKIDYDIE